jgi:pentapeptide MXKDX repeat protein
MVRLLRAAFGIALLLGLGWGVVGCTSSQPAEKDKMSKDKMMDDKKDKMMDDKMGKDKMTDDKMGKDKMATEKK